MSKIDLLLKYRVPYYKTLGCSTFCVVVSGFTPAGMERSSGERASAEALFI